MTRITVIFVIADLKETLIMQLYLISKDGKVLKKWIFKYMNSNFHSEESEIQTMEQWQKSLFGQ